MIWDIDFIQSYIDLVICFREFVVLFRPYFAINCFKWDLLSLPFLPPNFEYKKDDRVFNFYRLRFTY